MIDLSTIHRHVNFPKPVAITSRANDEGERRPPQLLSEPMLGWVQGFVLFELLCQLALLVPGIAPIRIVLRCAAFGASLFMPFILKGNTRGYRHPATAAAICVSVILFFALFHPTSNTLIAGLAQIGIYTAILAPLYWVPGTGMTAASFRQVVLTFWTFHALSSGLGVLQVYIPNRFEPPLSPVIAARGADYVDSLKIQLPGGAWVFRPMGLTDQPGGAATAGLYTVLFGLGLFLSEKRRAVRILALGSMAVGMFVLYLSQVRSVLIMAGICVATICILLGLRGDFTRMMKAVGLMAGLTVVSFIWAVSMGGDVVTKRLSSLVSEPAGQVYYSNRGHFLEDTLFRVLPQAPLGAGLGRWGMMNQYFGDPLDRNASTIWVEIQWTGWVLDGGVPLVLAYITAIGLAFLVAWRISSDQRENGLALWGALVFAYNMAAFAVTFNYPLFNSQSGLEFWLLNAALFAAWQAERKTASAIPAGNLPQRRKGHQILPRPAVTAMNPQPAIPPLPEVLP